MPAFTIQVEGLERYRALLRRLPPKLAQRALPLALNKTATRVRSQIVKRTGREVGVKQKDVRKLTVLRRASRARPRASVGVSLERLPLYALGARQTKKGVSYKAGAKRAVIKGAFIATMGTGHTGVFKRKGKDRLPIVELRGPSLGAVLLRKFTRQVEADAASTLEKELARQVDRLVGSS